MSVSDKGDMQNVQSSGSRGTGLKITTLEDCSSFEIGVSCVCVCNLLVGCGVCILLLTSTWYQNDVVSL